MENSGGKKKRIGIICGAVAAAAVCGVLIWQLGFGGGNKTADPQNMAYVAEVSELTGQNSGLGNVYTGVVESQDTWSARLKDGGTVKEVLVEVGQEVKKGEALFTYDTANYEDELAQAQIDLERQQHELDTMKKTLAQLEAEKKKAPAADQANFTMQIQDQQLQIREKELDLQTKQGSIEKIKENMKQSTVSSDIDGVVKSVGRAGAGSGENAAVADDGSSDGSFITIMQTGDLRVKGTVNEQNVSSLMEGTPVVVQSRVSDQTWPGTISKVDTGETQSSDNSFGVSFGGNGGDTQEAQTASKYTFYVALDSSEGLLMGQHVYVEPADAANDRAEGLWLSQFYVDETDPEHPFVWMDKKGKLAKAEVTIGERDDAAGEVQITKGLEKTDKIAQPMPNLKEGMRTAPMSDMPADYSVQSGSDVMIEDLPTEGEMVVGGSSLPAAGEMVTGDGSAPAGADTGAAEAGTDAGAAEAAPSAEK